MSFKRAGPTGPFVDEERGISLQTIDEHPQRGRRFLLTFGDESIPFVAHLQLTRDLPDGDDLLSEEEKSLAPGKQPTVWIVENLGVGADRDLSDRRHDNRGAVRNIVYKFRDSEQEAEFAHLVEEVLREYRNSFGLGSPIKQVRFRDTAWQHSRPESGDFAVAGDGDPYPWDSM